MATVTKIVGSSGSADYATISLWYAARRAQPSAGDIEVCVLENGDHDWSSWQGGWNDVALTIKFQGQNSHGGVWANGARIVPTGQLGLASREDDTTIEFIDLVFDFPAAYRPLAIGTSSTTTSKATNVTWTRCLCYNADTGSPIVRQASNAPGLTTVTATNSVFEGVGGPAFDVPWHASNASDVAVTLTACTVRDAIITLQANSSNSSSNGSVIANGCLISIDASMNGGQMVRMTANSYARGGSSVDCITSEAEATHDNWADNSRTHANYSTTFLIDGSTPASGQVAWTGGSGPKYDFSLVESSNNLAIGWAVNATMPSVDVKGTTRDASPDAGAFESATVTITEHVTTGTWSAPVTFAAGDQYILTLTGGGSATNARCRIAVQTTDE